MKKVTTLHFRPSSPRAIERIELLGQPIEIEHISCEGDLGAIAAYINQLDGKVDAIALDGLVHTLRLGKEKIEHEDVDHIFKLAETTPVVDGMGIRDAMESWAIRLVAEKEPGIFANKKVLLVPGLNHVGLANALHIHTGNLRYADPLIFFNLPNFPLVGSEETLGLAASRTLQQLSGFEQYRLFPQMGLPDHPRSSQPFDETDILAGDVKTIRRYAPDQLFGKMVVVPSASDEDVADLTQRGVRILITTLPALSDEYAQHSSAIFEACLAAIIEDKSHWPTENTYLDLLYDYSWQPAIRYLIPEEADINRFAFVTHPLDADTLPQTFHWSRYLPKRLAERAATLLPPVFLSRTKGIESPVTGQKVEGVIFSMGGTVQELQQRDSDFIRHRLLRAVRMAEQLDARILGVETATNVIAEAAADIAPKTEIALTSGSSLLIAVTLEAAQVAMKKMNPNDDLVRAMVWGADSPTGRAAAHWLAQSIKDLTLADQKTESLLRLKRELQAANPELTLQITTRPSEHLPEMDLVVTADSASTAVTGQRPLDITFCQVGTVICDIARPTLITPHEANLRPDVVVVTAGEVQLPGTPELGYDNGRSSGVISACMAETILLAIEGRFEDYTLGRELSVDRVAEIYDLYKKHQFSLGGIRSHMRFLSDEALEQKSQLAAELRRNPDKQEALTEQSRAALVNLPSPQPQAVKSGTRSGALMAAGIVGLLALTIGWLFSRRKRKSE